MTRKRIYDPYIEVLDEFNRQGVSYVVIGMCGINYYAQGAKETFSTQDFDIFVKPTIDNLNKTISIFKKLKYSLSVGKEKIAACSIKKIVKDKTTILATDAYGITFELILSVSGYTFNQMVMDATIFKVKNIPIKVGRLSKLLTSKKIAARKKDKLFLRRYEILLKEKSASEK